MKDKQWEREREYKASYPRYYLPPCLHGLLALSFSFYRILEYKKIKICHLNSPPEWPGSPKRSRLWSHWMKISKEKWGRKWREIHGLLVFITVFSDPWKRMLLTSAVKSLDSPGRFAKAKRKDRQPLRPWEAQRFAAFSQIWPLTILLLLPFILKTKFRMNTKSLALLCEA